MVTISFRQICPALLAVTVFALMAAQPLWADEDSTTTTPQKSQEQESVFKVLKRKSQKLFKPNPPTQDAKEQSSEPTEQKSQEENTSKKSDGKKALNAVQKEMKKISENISKSVERDKKNAQEKTRETERLTIIKK